jgi:hypothetical protein
MPWTCKTNSIAAPQRSLEVRPRVDDVAQSGDHDSCGSAMPLLRETWEGMNSASGQAPTRAATPNGAPLAIQCVRAFYRPPELLAGQHNVSQFECRPREQTG